VNGHFKYCALVGLEDKKVEIHWSMGVYNTWAYFTVYLPRLETSLFMVWHSCNVTLSTLRLCCHVA